MDRDAYGGPGSGMMPLSPQQVEMQNQMAAMDMDHQYYDDQIFSDIGGSLKQQDAAQYNILTQSHQV